mgnify:CR=1 FL=1
MSSNFYEEHAIKWIDLRLQIGERDRWTIYLSYDILYAATYSARSFLYEISARQIGVGVFSVRNA